MNKRWMKAVSEEPKCKQRTCPRVLVAVTGVATIGFTLTKSANLDGQASVQADL